MSSVKFAKNTIQPQSGTEKHCVVMMTNTLAEPDWITIPCNQKIPTTLICQKLLMNKHLECTQNHPFVNIKNIQSCNYSELFIDNRCIRFKKYNINTNLSELIYENKVSLDMKVLQGKLYED